eukprot:jgi/Chlat1/4877/Chrsp31S04815
MTVLLWRLLLLLLLVVCAVAADDSFSSSSPARLFQYNRTDGTVNRWSHAAWHVQRLQRIQILATRNAGTPVTAADPGLPEADRAYPLPQKEGATTVPLICSGGRLLPQAFVIGAATTTIWGYLVNEITGHGRVWSYPKEQQFFGRPQDLFSNPIERLHLYRKLFPECSMADNGALQYIVDASPDYMLHAESGAAHIAQMYGPELARKLKFIVSLRDPTAQLFSWFNHLGRHDRIPCNVSFDEWVPYQVKRARECLEYADKLGDIRRIYLACQGSVPIRNWYVAGLAVWLSYFSADSMLVLDFAAIKEDPRQAVQQVFDHLGMDLRPGALPEEHLNDATTHKNECPNQESYLPETGQLLEDFYRPFNVQLRTLLLQLYPDQPVPEFAERDYKILMQSAAQ